MGPYPRPDKEAATISPEERARGRQADLDAAKMEGAREAERKTDEAVDRIRSDATAVETTARLLDNVPALPRGQLEKVVETLYAFAAGMRAAADMVPDSREIPF